MKFLTKKTVLLLGLFFLLVVVSAILIQNNCKEAFFASCNEAWLITGHIGGVAVIPAVLLLPFSLLTFVMRPHVFEAWKNFAKWSVPILLVMTTLASIDTGGGIGGLIEQAIYSYLIIGSLGIYMTTSLVIIGVAFFWGRKN